MRIGKTFTCILYGRLPTRLSVPGLWAFYFKRNKEKYNQKEMTFLSASLHGLGLASWKDRDRRAGPLIAFGQSFTRN